MDTDKNHEQGKADEMTKEYGYRSDSHGAQGDCPPALSPATPGGSHEESHSHSNLEIQEPEQKSEVESHKYRAERPERPSAEQTIAVRPATQQRQKKRNRQYYLPGTVKRDQMENRRQKNIGSEVWDNAPVRLKHLCQNRVRL